MKSNKVKLSSSELPRAPTAAKQYYVTSFFEKNLEAEEESSPCWQVQGT